jgi:hypothetical protein
MKESDAGGEEGWIFTDVPPELGVADADNYTVGRDLRQNLGVLFNPILTGVVSEALYYSSSNGPSRKPGLNQTLQIGAVGTGLDSFS